jgi:hypothetical protein
MCQIQREIQLGLVKVLESSSAEEAGIAAVEIVKVD